MSHSQSIHDSQKGFTLIEVMVAMVIALVILAGLILSFNSQYSEYKYQNKRINTSQDLEFVSNFITNDIRDALAVGGSVQISHTENGAGQTTDLYITVWEPDANYWPAGTPDASKGEKSQAQANYQAVRHYQYVPGVKPEDGEIRYDRNTLAGGDNPQTIMSSVSFFRMFDDVPGTAPSGFVGAPQGMAALKLVNRAGEATFVPGYTVLIEAAVDSGYKTGVFKDVQGNSVGVQGLKRVWRYVQVHPQAAL